MGRIVAPHGVRGALKVLSYADPPESLLQHRHWRLRAPGPARDAGAEGDAHLRTVEVVESAAQGGALRVRIDGVDDRDAAEALRDYEILIERDARPETGAREHYRDDLLGFSVRTVDGMVLGVLSHFLEAPAGALMVVRGERERWLPASPPCLRRVHVAERMIEVDWPTDF